MLAFPRRCSSLAVVVAALFVAACANRDAWLTPPGDRARGDLLDAGASALTALPGDTTETVIVIDPTLTAIYPLGRGNALIVRAGGLCDLASDYGPGTWDLPCLAAALPVTVTARTWYDTGSHPHIDFSPSLRFAPFDGNRASAELWLRDRTASRSSSSVIQYCTDDGCVDEGAMTPRCLPLATGSRGSCTGASSISAAIR